MNARDEPGDRRGTRQLAGVAIGIAGPLAVTALAWTVGWLSDRSLGVGPLDRATFGWVVVIPVWLIVPVVGAIAWGRLTPRNSKTAAIVVGALVSGVSADLFWQAVTSSGAECQFGPTRRPIDWVPPSLVVGLAIGGGLALSGLLAAMLVRTGRPWRAGVVAAGAELACTFAAILVAAAAAIGSGCQRPPV